MLLSEFMLQPETGIRVAPGVGAPAGYLDGAEQQLLSVLTGASDRTVASEELRRQIRDWPSQYHLTPYRSTIFDCFGFSAGDARVLELGAGCGAITRWLGEHCGQVHAIEGSIHRARVARARCAELDHVTVYSANYSELAEEDAFDVVTLIGVLEYGHLYHPRFPGDPSGAALDNLRLARRALRGDGVLVLAIENRLGIKYFNGAREDHSGKLFEGVQGYPHSTSAVTFSAHELRQMLAAAGFSEVGLYLPYPDYKLATTIVNAEHAGADSGAHNWLPETAPDRGMRRTTALYHEALAQRELSRAGLLPHFANSFLMLAYAGDRIRTDERHGLDTEWRTRHYSLERRPGLQKRVTIGAPGDRTVRNEPVSGCEPSGGAGVLEHRLQDEQLHDGELLVFDVHAAIAGAGFGDPFLGVVARHRDWLAEEFATGWVDDAGIPLLDGEAFDATWWNVVREPDSRWRRIDREWRFRVPVPIDYVVWRTLFHYALRFGLHLPSPWHGADPSAFAEHWLREFEPGLAADRLTHLHELERMVNASVDVRGGPAPPVPPSPSGRVCITASVEELLANAKLLAGYVNAFGPDDPVILTLGVDEAESTQQIARLREALEQTGVAEDQQPDIVVGLSGHPGTNCRTACAAAVLTRESGPAAPASERTPHLASSEALRRLVDERTALARASSRATPPDVHALVEHLASGWGCDRIIELAAADEALLQVPDRRDAGLCVIDDPELNARTVRDLERIVSGATVTVVARSAEDAEADLRALGESLGRAPVFLGQTRSDANGARDAAIAIFEGDHVPVPGPPPESFRVLAVVTAFNERDIIPHTISRLLAQGVEVHLLDNWSKDGTVELVQRTISDSRLTIERFPDTDTGTYEWQRILTRVEEVAAASGADWTIHHDADEIRQSPWPGVDLRAALYRVHSLGFDAIDHTVLDFRPVDDGFEESVDPLEYFTHCEFGRRPGHFVQVKGWRNRGRVRLAASGGHSAEFENRRVFPYKFLLRHYPLRSQSQAERKIFADRQPRFTASERAAGWHTQYDAVRRGQSFLYDPASLLRFDDDFCRRFLTEVVTGAGILGPMRTQRRSSPSRRRRVRKHESLDSDDLSRRRRPDDGRAAVGG